MWSRSVTCFSQARGQAGSGTRGEAMLHEGLRNEAAAVRLVCVLCISLSLYIYIYMYIYIYIYIHTLSLSLYIYIYTNNYIHTY